MKHEKQNIGLWQYIMLLLSLMALVLLAFQSFFLIDAESAQVLFIIDTLICALFFADFVWQLIHSGSRIAYLKWGWLDLISSIPIIPAFRIARLARIARIIRVLRGTRASKHMLGFVLIHRARNTFGAVLFGAFVLLAFSAIAIVNFEPSLTPHDAIWWCLFTLTTGEYGDFYPPSTEGRIITLVLMTAGVAVFGTFTASVASFFIGEDQAEDEDRDNMMMEEIIKLRQEISELKHHINEEKSNNDV